MHNDGKPFRCNRCGQMRSDMRSNCPTCYPATAATPGAMTRAQLLARADELKISAEARRGWDHIPDATLQTAIERVASGAIYSAPPIAAAVTRPGAQGPAPLTLEARAMAAAAGVSEADFAAVRAKAAVAYQAEQAQRERDTAPFKAWRS